MDSEVKVVLTVSSLGLLISPIIENIKVVNKKIAKGKPRSVFSGAQTTNTPNPIRFRITFQIESTANRCRADDSLRYLRPTLGLKADFLS